MIRSKTIFITCIERQQTFAGDGTNPAYLRGAVWVRDDLHNVIEWQEGVTVDLCEDILPLGAVSK